MENHTLLPMVFNTIRKYVLVKHFGECSYGATIASVMRTFNLPVGPITLYDYTTECEISEEVFIYYIKKADCFIRVRQTVLDMEPDYKVFENCFPTPPYNNITTQAVEYTNPIPSSGVTQPVQQHELTNTSVEVPKIPSISENNSTLDIMQVQNFMVTEQLPDELETADDLYLLIQSQMPVITGKINTVETLTSCEKSQLSRTIIKYVLDYQTKMIDRSLFLKLADLIVSLFPGETASTYFIPSIRGKFAKGKLYHSYNNYRCKLSRTGIITRRPIRRRFVGKFNPLKTKRRYNRIKPKTEVDDHDDGVVLLLHNFTGTLDEILPRWKVTHEARMRILKRLNDPREYISTFPMLSDLHAHELFKIDTLAQFPNMKSFENWDNYSNKVLELGKDCADLPAKQILHFIMRSHINDRNILTLLLLPHILLNFERRKRHSTQSQSDIQQMFIVHLMPNNFPEQTNDKTNIHPKLFLVGTPITLCYVMVNNRKFMFDNPKDAVTACFCFYIGLKLRYPAESEQVWMFLQKLIFGVHTKYDLTIYCVRELINHLNS